MSDMTMTDLMARLEREKSVTVIDSAGRRWHVLRLPDIPNDYVPVYCQFCGHPGFSHGEADYSPCSVLTHDGRCACPGWTAERPHGTPTDMSES